MFIPNQTAQIRRVLSRNVNGESVYGLARNVRFAIVRLSLSSEPTSVRTDKSASRSAARELMAKAKVLIAKDEDIILNDKFIFGAFELRIVSIEPRYSVTGALDHNEVILDYWDDL